MHETAQQYTSRFRISSRGLLLPGRKMGGQLDVQSFAEIGGHGEGAIVADEHEDVVRAVEQRGAMAAVGKVALHALPQPGINIIIEIVRDLMPDLVTAYFH
jgi:hypothetical protein